ncbi:MAG: TnpV protein [Candidatus Ornithomonoglobus sp.]
MTERFIENGIKYGSIRTAPYKAAYQMEWVGHMNNAKTSAEELINHELVYA